MRHELYDDPDLYDRLMPEGPCESFYRALARRTRGRVLELACGTGRLTIPMALEGANVTGLDISRPMLAAARRKAAIAGASVAFCAGDMRSFDLDARFGLIVVSCNSFAHLTSDADLRNALARIRSHLDDEGLLAFDVVHPRIERLVDTGPRTADHASLIVIEETTTYDPVAQVQNVSWRVGPEGEPLSFALRLFFPRELPVLLASTGLELIERYGDFGRAPLDAGSPLQVCIARPR